LSSDAAMSISMKLGHGLFNKELKIDELQKKCNALEKKNEEILKHCKDIEETLKKNERAFNEMKNRLSVKELDAAHLEEKLKKKESECESLKQRLSKVENEEKEGLKTINNYSESLDDYKAQLLSKDNLEKRLRQELLLTEKRNNTFEKRLEDLQELLNKKDQEVEVLSKSLSQKDKYNQILVKEKERSQRKLSDEKKKVKNKENEPLHTYSKREDLEEYIKSSTKNESDVSQLKRYIVELEKDLKERDKQLEKLRLEKFELATRLKNRKLT
jgi:chromosome segregation ATPase